MTTNRHFTFTRKRWSWLAVAGCAAALWGMCVIPVRRNTVVLLTAVVFLGSLAATAVAGFSGDSRARGNGCFAPSR